MLPGGTEGPTTLEARHQVCGMCRHHDQRMQRSGLDPVYDHYCKHPDSPKVLEFIDRPGAWIGESDRTPGWCPILKG